MYFDDIAETNGASFIEESFQSGVRDNQRSVTRKGIRMYVPSFCQVRFDNLSIFWYGRGFLWLQL